MSVDKARKLARMANQIGDFYAAMPEAEAVESTAKHLQLFWAPKMIRDLVACAADGAVELNPTARQAVERVGRESGSGAPR